MLHETRVSRDYFRKDKYHEYRKCMWGTLLIMAMVAVPAIVFCIYPYYNGNTNQLTAEEFQKDIVGIAAVVGITAVLAIVFFFMAKWELKKIQKEDLEKSLHGEQKEKEKIENFNPFI